MPPILLLLLGLVVGSFLNVLIYRIPRGEGFVVGSSRCTTCRHDLAWYDLIPLVSYLLLRGRCRYCAAPFSIRYPIVELISGLFFVFAPSVFILIELELFLVIAFIDAEHLIIPDGLLLALLAVVIASNYHAVLSWHQWVAVVSYAGFFFSLWWVSRGRWIGFGDVKLAAVLGLLFGFPAGLLVIYVAVILGAIVGIFLMVTRRATMKTAVPFGTLLAISACCFLFYQDTIIGAVLRLLNFS